MIGKMSIFIVVDTADNWYHLQTFGQWGASLSAALSRLRDRCDTSLLRT